MIVSEVSYTSNVVYILFENGHLISREFGKTYFQKRTNASFCFQTKSHPNYPVNGFNKTCSKTLQLSCLNGGTCVVFRNQTQCFCKTSYFGSKCENKSNLLLGLKAFYNLT